VPFPSRRWPHGPERPGVATAAAVLGFVTGGLTLLMSIVFIGALAGDEGDPATGVLLLGLPCAIGLIVGGVRLLGRRPPVVLFASALAAVLVLVLALITGLATTVSDTNSVIGLSLVLGFAAPLPIVTAVLAWRPVVAHWVAAA
jgi:hypothetical protein